MTFGLVPKQPGRCRSCACPHLWFSGGFTRPPGTSTRNHPHDPTTSKPVVPGGYVCPPSIAFLLVAFVTSNAEPAAAPPRGHGRENGKCVRFLDHAPAHDRPGRETTIPPSFPDQAHPEAATTSRKTS